MTRMMRVTSTLVITVAATALGCMGSIEQSGDSPRADNVGGRPSPSVPGSDGLGSGDKGVSPPPGAVTNLEITTALARRLTRDELIYTLQDVLGIELTATESQAVPVDRIIEGFVNIATGQSASPNHVTGYAAVARGVSARFDVADFVTRGSICQDKTPACAAAFVKAMGLRLFRRPPDDQEVKDFSGLFAEGLNEGEDFLGAARIVMEGMLQSPQFLYRLERETTGATRIASGKVRVVGSYEMASRLSYFLWSSAPDDALYDAARTGVLDEATGVAGQAARMLGDSARSRRATERFITDMARIEALSDDSGLREELTSSLRAYYQDLVWTKKEPLLGVFTARRAFLTPTLAKNYGLASTGDGVREYDLSRAAGRIGLLTQPGYIAGMTNVDGEAMVARGLFLQEEVFCGQPPPPPASLQETIDAFLKEKPKNATDRQTAEIRLGRPECGACHGQFDPVAFAFERFDYLGGYREMDEHGSALRTDGWIPESMSPDGKRQQYATTEDYAGLVAQSPTVQACFVKQNLQFALGRRADVDLEVIEHELVKPFIQRGGTYADLVAILVHHPVFSQMKVE